MSNEKKDLGPLKAVGDKIWHSEWHKDVEIVEVRQIGPKSPEDGELSFMAYTVKDEDGEMDSRFANWFHVNAKGGLMSDSLPATTPKVYWSSPLPDACQATGEPFNGVMYDANLSGYGWGNYCFAAFDALGGKLGMGFGQKYRLQDDGRWLKVAG